MRRSVCETLMPDAVQGRLRAVGLGPQDGPVGHIRVPFDQQRFGARLVQNVIQQRPDRIDHLAPVAVDQQRVAVIIFILIMTAQVNFTYLCPAGRRRYSLRREIQIGGRDKDVVHIQQQATACAARDLTQEIGFGPGAFFKRQIAGGVFQAASAARRCPAPDRYARRCGPAWRRYRAGAAGRSGNGCHGWTRPDARKSWRGSASRPRCFSRAR